MQQAKQQAKPQGRDSTGADDDGGPVHDANYEHRARNYVNLTITSEEAAVYAPQRPDSDLCSILLTWLQRTDSMLKGCGSCYTRTIKLPNTLLKLTGRHLQGGQVDPK
jgi:hypothetical protein